MNSQSQKLLRQVDLVGDANHLHGYITTRLTCKFYLGWDFLLGIMTILMFIVVFI